VYALPTEAVTLTGNGFKASTLTTITFDGGTFVPVTATTDVNGTFTAVIVIPAGTILSAVPYTATATQAGPVTATASITVNYYLTVTPSGAVSPVPPGVTVTFGGKITPSTTFSIAIDTVPVASGTSDVNGRITASYTLPDLIAAATHTVTLTAGALVVPPASLTTGITPTATLSAASGYAGQLITVTLANFDSRANITVSFGTTVVNSTLTDARFGPTASGGTLVAVFSVPAITPGVYTATVVDQYGAKATVVAAFTVLAAPQTTITTAATFAQGDTINFDIKTTDPAAVSMGIAIKDPTGLYWWGTPAVHITWPVTLVDGVTGVVLYTNQIAFGLDNMHLTLPANAPTGSWNWTVFYASSMGATSKTGLFTVIAGGVTGLTTQVTALNTTITSQMTGLNSTIAAQMAALNSSITALNGLDAKITSIQGSIVTLTTNVGQVTTSVSSLSSSISSINSGVATIQTSLGTVTTSLTSIDAVIGVIAGDTATIKTSIGEITTPLASIGTTVTGISGDVATIHTDLGTLTGTVTSVSGNVATIQTSLGTMQTSIGNLQADVTSTKDSTGSLSTLIIVAIVLALLAAIAAIASIVLMRRKIAG